MTDLPARDDFMIPVLRVMQDGKSRKRSEILSSVANLMGLTEEQRLAKYDTGAEIYPTNFGFVLSYLLNVGALDRVSRGIYQINEAGRKVLEKYPHQATEKELEAWAGEESSPIRPYQRKEPDSPTNAGDKIGEDSHIEESMETNELVDIPPPTTITDLAEKTFLDPSFLRDIQTLLTTKQQLILEGPPGSGKTYVAEQFARYFTGQSLTAAKTNDQIELVQFHQSYSYEDFVEGIRPRMDGGQLVYTVEAGIFLRMVARAADHPEKNYVLIIDEINRGNVSRILGELMLLLEYRDKSATLPYSKDQLQIPPNLYIIGTMNTADRSLSQIDYALRRRFYFVRFMSVENGEARVLDGWLRQQQLNASTHSTILQSFIALNQQLETDLGTDDLQVGHSYFMDANIHDDRHQQHIWTYAVLPLIREYLYHHRERDSLLQNYQLDRIVRVAEPAIDNQIELDAPANSNEDPE